MPVSVTTGQKQKSERLTNELVLWSSLLFGAVVIVACQQSINCTSLLFRMMI